MEIKLKEITEKKIGFKIKSLNDSKRLSEIIDNEIDLENYLEKSLLIDDTLKGKYLYSNLGAGLLGYTLSKIENVSYEDLLKNHIFSKYKMSRKI